MTRENAAANGVRARRARARRASPATCRRRTSSSRTSRCAVVEALARTGSLRAARRCPGYLAERAAGGRRAGATSARREAGGWAADCSTHGSSIARPWRASPSPSSAARCRTRTPRRCVSGCPRTGTSSGRHADVAVVNTCCVTHEALRKSRKAAARAARTHERVYVTGCGANLAGDAFAGLPANVVVVARPSEETPAAVAGDVGAIGCVQADARLDRVRAFVKIQDGCSFSCDFCVVPLVRGASRSRAAAAVLAEVRRRIAQGHRELVLTGINLGLLPRPRGRVPPAAARPRARRAARARPPAALVDRGQPRRRRARRARCARRRRSAATCTCRSSRATTTCCARWGAATRSPPSCGGSRRSPTSTSRRT